jgi:putative membrane protein
VIPIAALPACNAALNTAATVFLLLGYRAVRRRRIALHRACMVAAFVTSVAFLASYLVYHAHAGSTRFAGTGWVRPLYFTILATHTVLAALIPFLAVTTLWLALRRQFTRHARLARLTLPAWLYVSVTGVLIYLMLYRWVPSAGAPTG